MKRSREEYAPKPSADNRQQIADSRSTSRPVLLPSAICLLLSGALSLMSRSVQYRSPHPSPMSALLYAVFASGAVWCLRLAPPFSRRAMIVLALLPLCLTGRALLTGGIYAPIDIAYTNE